MPKPLVIVESPAKARTIAGFLGADYVVKASIGHVRDLPQRGSDARKLGVDVENDFRPEYEVHANKRDVIRDLKAALKDADELYLATDEDREGEAISWHLLEVLKPRVPVKRMVFHEITKTAIEAAVLNWRDVDYGLVDAQESRRIVDRLFGYPVSEVCWRKIKPGLSAGRVQSPAVRLVVQRERERIAFRAAAWWDLDAAFPTNPAFTADLATLGDDKVADGRDFDSAGALKKESGIVVLDEAGARALAASLDGAAFTVADVQTKPYTSRPKPPFVTSSLQQVAGNRLRMTSAQVMRVAQGLYERGYITYMRTDSTTLSEAALGAAAAQIGELYGQDYLSAAPRHYAKKAKAAQEAHEAIRPAGDSFRSPEQLRSELRGDDLALYELVWQRTIASQMPDARGSTLTARIEAVTHPPTSPVIADGTVTGWTTSGTTITFPGYLRVYGHTGDDSNEDGGDAERKLPQLTVGATLPAPSIEALGHATQPPARYTEASLVKALEERGIGRPSTYASIMQTIQDRGYVWKKGSALVPTTDAFALVNLLEQHFAALVDYDFTAYMEAALDEIASRNTERIKFLEQFWLGNGTPGVDPLCKLAIEEADPARINVVREFDLDGTLVELRNGKFGPYLRCGEDSRSLPDDVPLDELTDDRVREILAAPKGDEPIGTDEATGLPVFAKNGRYGPYVQLGTPDEPPPGETKPRMASLFKDMDLTTITVDDALRLLSLPRVVGRHPADDGEIVAANGRYGPFLKWGDETRSLETEAQLFDVSLDAAVAILAEPKKFGRQRSASAAPLKVLGPDPVSGGEIVVKDGRFGPYVTDGTHNASLRKGDTIEELTPERAYELLVLRREYEEMNPKKPKAAKKRAPAKKKAAPRKAAKKKE
ncbi:MAG: type I DNA topoisomerase [Acidimicrobiia bacterium]|nr:type I DNA topoisomerase [Acidimicrobiia bacterium]